MSDYADEVFPNRKPIESSRVGTGIDNKPRAVDDMHASIDARLDKLRGELAGIAPVAKKPPQRPSLAPAPEPPRNKTRATLLYMPSFYTSQIRTARQAVRAGANACNVQTGTRPHSPRERPIGYRIQDVHPSSPAYTMRKKIVLSANLDPAIPDDGPGPGAYDLLKY